MVWLPPSRHCGKKQDGALSVKRNESGGKMGREKDTRADRASEADSSKAPKTRKPRSRGAFRSKRMKGLEPSTFCMASRRSSQLSYIRMRSPEYTGTGNNRGDGRIRTGVHGFAGRCVASPPRRQDSGSLPTEWIKRVMGSARWSVPVQFGAGSLGISQGD